MELKLFSVLKKRGSCSTLLTLDISASSLLSAMLFPMLFSCQPMITWLAEATAWPSCCRSFLTQLNHFCFVIPVLLRMHVLRVKTSYEHRCNYFVYKKKQWPLKDKQNTSTSPQDHSSQLFIIIVYFLSSNILAPCLLQNKILTTNMYLPEREREEAKMALFP